MATNPVALDPHVKPVLVQGDATLHKITDDISKITENQTPKKWYVAIGITSTITLILLAMLTYLVFTGIGVWGNNVPVAWAWDITNFVFWIGIGHAGTLISAILFLFRQKWRTSINRAAEAMTLMAVACALIYPAFHIGRVWLAYYLFPLPNEVSMWGNSHSPLLWDVFAVSAYGTVSLLFWFLGLVPDVA